MDVILLERVEKLGQIGDVVSVKAGFARNYLLPRKKALRANEANKKVFEANRAQIEADNANRRGNAEAEAKVLDDKSVTLIRQASNTARFRPATSSRRSPRTASRCRSRGSFSAARSRRSASTR